MESSVIVVILLIFFYCIIFSLASNDIDQSPDNKHTVNTEEQKILAECQHSDYRTYIKCLKRQKRHHGHTHWDRHNSTGGSRSCFEDCGMDECSSSQCVHDCNLRCMKKTKETRIVQYETDCGDNADGNCNSKKEGSYHQAPNITTNIDVNNIIHNHLPIDNEKKGDRDGKEGDRNNKNYTESGISPGTLGISSGFPGGYGLSIIPQIQLVPQLTFGIGLGPIGGCLSGMNWPCIQQSQSNPATLDCSQCNNPFFRLRCEVSCLNQVNTNNSQNFGRRY